MTQICSMFKIPLGRIFFIKFEQCHAAILLPLIHLNFTFEFDCIDRHFEFSIHNDFIGDRFADLVPVSLMIFQLRSLKKYHPNAELLIASYLTDW